MINVRTLPVDGGNEEITLSLDTLAREGARRMIVAALRAEAEEYVERFSDEVDEDGLRSWSVTAASGSEGHDRVGHDPGPGAQGQRQAQRRGG